MNKVLVKLYVPLMEEEFEIWLPINKKIGEVIFLLCKSINELTGGSYTPEEMPGLYDKYTGEQLDIHFNLKEANIRNNSELILL